MQQLNETDFDIDIEDIIRNERIITLFQPIVSIKKKSLIGLEALSRGFYKGRPVAPDILFKIALKNGMVLELDRLCRRKALESFARSSFKDRCMLFMNMDASIIDTGAVGSGKLISMVRKYKLNPSDIVIEINEAWVMDTKALRQFIDSHREYGFIIALDDVGAGYSNLSRLSLVKPDIIKADRVLLKNIHEEFYKQEVLKSLINLSKKIGSLVVAEGIENAEEGIMSLDLGVDMLQGFLFSKPMEMEYFENHCMDLGCSDLAERFKAYEVGKLVEEKERKLQYELIFKKIIRELENTDPKAFDNELERIIQLNPLIECIYILDISGIQASSTICSFSKFTGMIRPIFNPAPKGTDHSIKRYYYVTKETEKGLYITEPYISLASGNLCLTLSSVFHGGDGQKYIICFDININ